MGFLEENEVILVARKKGDHSARREEERPPAFHCRILRLWERLGFLLRVGWLVVDWL